MSPVSMRPRPARRRQLVLMLLMTLGLLVVPSSASAWGCEEKLYPVPDVTGQGVDSVLNSDGVIDRTPHFQAPPEGDKGLYEQYLVSGTGWHTVIEDSSCTDEQRMQVWPHISNMLWGLARGLDMAAIEAVRFAIAPPLDELEAVVVDVVEQLRDQVWRPLLPALTILGAVTLAWWGLVRKRAMLSVEGLVWMIAATTVGMWILYAPAGFMGTVNSVLAWGENLMTAAVTTATEDSEAGRCLEDAPPILQSPSEDHREFVARQQSEGLYEALVCQPFKVGAFGSGANAEALAQEHGSDLIDAQALDRTESISAGLGEGESEFYDEAVQEKNEEFQRISGEIEEAHTPTWDMFRGAEGGQRTMAALVGLVAALTGGLLMLAAAVGLLVVKLGFLLLMLMSPIFFLLGMHPGWGRGVLLRWVELLAGIFLKIWMWMAVLLILTLVLNTILGSVEPYGLALVLMVALVVAVLKFKDDVWGTLTSPKISGSAPGSGGGGGYSPVKDRLVGGAMRAGGSAVRSGTKLAAKGGLKAAKLGGFGVATGAAAMMRLEAATARNFAQTNGKTPHSEKIAQGFDKLHNQAEKNAPDRYPKSVAEEEKVRQGSGAQRPTTQRRGGESPRASEEAPERRPEPAGAATGGGARGRPASHPDAGEGVSGDRRPEDAPGSRGPNSGGGRPSTGGGPRTGGGGSGPGPQRRAPRGGKGGNS